MRIVCVSFLLLWGFERGIDKPDLRVVYTRLALVLVLLDPLLTWHHCPPIGLRRQGELRLQTLLFLSPSVSTELASRMLFLASYLLHDHFVEATLVRADV